MSAASTIEKPTTSPTKATSATSPTPTSPPRSDTATYLERRGWTPSPHNNLWQRVNVVPQDDGSGSARITVLEEALEPLAFERQTARDISALIARVETLSGESAARLATITALEKGVAKLEKGVAPGVAAVAQSAPKPVAAAPAPVPATPAPTAPAKGGR